MVCKLRLSQLHIEGWSVGNVYIQWFNPPRDLQGTVWIQPGPGTESADKQTPPLDLYPIQKQVEFSCNNETNVKKLDENDLKELTPSFYGSETWCMF